MFRRFLPYFRLLRPIWLAFGATLLSGVIYGATSGFGLPFVTAKVFPLVFGKEMQSSWMLLGVIAILPAVFFVRGLAGFLNVYGLSYCGLRVLRAIQSQVFERLQSLPLEFFDQNSTGDLMSRLTGDAASLQNVITGTANSLVKQPVTFVGAMGAMIYLSSANDQLLFALFCVLLVPFIALMMRFTGEKLRQRAAQLQAQSGVVAARIQENLTAAKEIRTFTLEQRELARFRGALDLAHKLALKVVKYTNVLSPVVEFVAAIGVALVMYYAVSSGVTLEQLIPLIVALFMSYQPLRSAGVIYNQFKTGLASLDRLEYILCYEDTIKDPERPVNVNGVRGQVEFRNVSFGYVDASVLREINQKIEPGEVIALVGASGAGKTTFASLIPRLYETSAGEVLLDGVDVRQYLKTDLRGRIAVVPQDPMLFNDTIRNNILIGRPDASSEQLERAARAAHAHEFVEALPQAYDTIVGDRGTRLSGGEKQRLSIARAFLKDAPILILDEATSSLDSESESAVHQALEKLIQGRTTIIIAHRFSTVKIASRILVFDSGRIVASGTHDGLYADCAIYRNLYDKQI